MLKLWKRAMHLLHHCPYYFKYIFILSVLWGPVSILILVLDLSGPLILISPCSLKAGAPEILPLFTELVGDGTKRRACLAVHHAKYRGSLELPFLLRIFQCNMANAE